MGGFKGLDQDHDMGSSIHIAAKALVTLGYWRKLSITWVNVALEAALVSVDDMLDIILEQ
jgi:hypothetical protein